MSFKQEKHGKKGEARTTDILLDHFIVHQIIPDIEGRDFMAELHGNVTPVNAIIQSKFFENGNEVIIRKEYIIDEEDVKTDFFAILHTDDNRSTPVRYFFTAKEIRDNWRSSKRKKGKKYIDYFVFKLNKRDFNNFEKFKGKTNQEINETIEEGILKTDEFRNQKYIRTIKEGFKNPTQQVFGNNNNELFKRIKYKPIVDRLYEGLTQFKEFRRIVSWRLVDKISFSETPHTSTYYNRFTLSSNHSEIISFFNNLEISDKIVIKKATVFNKSQNYKRKISEVIQILNENLVFNFHDSVNNSSKYIRTERNNPCTCVSCSFDTLDFSNTILTLQSSSSTTNLWEQMRNGSVWFKLGNYEKAKDLFFDVSCKAKENKEQVLFFFAKFNERLSAIKNFDISYPDLSIELDKLYLSDEKVGILRSVADYSLFNGYAKSIDEIYLKIKDYKQRNVINDTGQLIEKLYASIVEYINFFEGNWLLINEFEESKVLFEKVIESGIVSFSMRTDFSNHLNHFDDLFVKIALLHCDSSKLLGYFQRNNLKGLPYKTRTNYLQKAIDNFFSKENTGFFIKEISYLNHRTKNPDLRRRIKQLFDNICILLAYLDHSIDLDKFLENMLFFIEKLDFNVHDISLLAHPFLSKPRLFKESEIVKLTKSLLLKDKLSEGYLLTNCLYTLKEKNVKINNDNEFADQLIQQAIVKPQFGLLKALQGVFPRKYLQKLEHNIISELNKKFNYRLFYNAIVTHSLSNYKEYVDSYFSLFKDISKKKDAPSFFNTHSPYTGISEPLRGNLNNLVEVLITINDKELLQNPIVEGITDKFPYYKFILNIDEFSQEDSLNVYWLLENQSEIVLKNVAKNEFVKNSLNRFLLTNQNERLSKIFIKYFNN